LKNSALKYCANLSFLFTELPLHERFYAAAAAGFDAVEIPFPYETSAADMGQLLSDNTLQLALINCPPPNYTDGPRGFAAVPELESRFQYDFRRALRYAGALGAQHLHVMSGVAKGDEARACFVRNLAWAAEFAPKQSLVIEPLHPGHLKDYFLTSFDQAIEILDEVGSDSIGLQFDSYQAHHIVGDATIAWETFGHRATHVQLASPDRSTPTDNALLNQIKSDGYSGWISGEYAPNGPTEDTLDWRI
jgi:hydroxypyruvate isomerase